MWSQVPEQRWFCDSIYPIKGNSSLHHGFDSSQEGCDYLVLRHDPMNIGSSFVCSFRIRHGFLPSGMNNWQLVLGAEFEKGSDQPGGEAQIINGILLGVNFTGSDDLVKIWQLENGVPEVLCATSLNYQEQAGTGLAPLFFLQGDGSGKLDVYWSPDPAEGEPAEAELEYLGSCRIDGIAWGRQLLLRYKYTSSRDRALWLDELVLEGHFEKDTISPEVGALELVDAWTLQLWFSEKVNLSESCSFILFSEDLPGGVTPTDIWESGEGIRITFEKEILNRRPYNLTIGGLADLDGNLMSDTTLPVLRNDVRWGDVVFNEVMADPEPAVRQIEEYLELFNRSDYPVNLEGWRLQVNERSYLLDASILTSWDRDWAGETGRGAELPPRSFQLLTGITLPNNGALLSLFSREETLVHAASYRIPWDGPDWKKEGGWSLESPDADQPCRISYNWEYSSNQGGGTPGWANSNQGVLTDREAPVLLYAGAGKPGQLVLHYNEPLLSFYDKTQSFRMDPGASIVDSVFFDLPLRDVLHLHFPEGFQEWPQYRLSIPGLSDCAGNESHEQVFTAGAISIPAAGSVLINEIMYDPEEGKSEYVELHLPGNRVLDLQDLAIHLVEEGGSPDKPVALSSHSRLILPGQYIVLSDCVAQLEESYNLEVSGLWVEVPGLPGLNNSSGCIYLTDRAGQLVDMAVYSDALHMELLGDPRGVSLERISGERPGSDPDNWHSAASIEAYATPGVANSQSHTVLEGVKLLDVAPEVFSPDNDGFEDILQITLNVAGSNWVVGLFISDLHGNRIRTLVNMHLAAPSLTYTWNGEGEDGSMLPMGFYVVHARGYNPATGEQWIRRKAVGLVYR